MNAKVAISRFNGIACGDDDGSAAKVERVPMCNYRQPTEMMSLVTGFCDANLLNVSFTESVSAQAFVAFALLVMALFLSWFGCLCSFINFRKALTQYSKDVREERQREKDAEKYQHCMSVFLFFFAFVRKLSYT